MSFRIREQSSTYIWRTPSGWKLRKYLYRFFVTLPWSHDPENVTSYSVSQGVHRTPSTPGVGYTPLYISDSVTRVSDSSRVTIFGDSDSTRVTLTKDGDSPWLTFFPEWLNSSHNQWLETRVRVIFKNSRSLWWTNPVCLSTKMSTFCFSNDKYLRKFSVLTF